MQEGIERKECGGYENGDGSLFKTSLELNKIYHELSEKRRTPGFDRCFSQKKSC